MKRKPKKHVIVPDTYDNIFSNAVMDDLKELYPDASMAMPDELATDLYFDNRRLLMKTFADTIFPTKRTVVCIGRCALTLDLQRVGTSTTRYSLTR